MTASELFPVLVEEFARAREAKLAAEARLRAAQISLGNGRRAVEREMRESDVQ